MSEITQYEASAMLSLQDDERAVLSRRMEDIVDGFSALERVNTDSVQPLVSVLDLKNILREDISEKMLPRDELLKNAPEQYDGYVSVPGTLE